MEATSRGALASISYADLPEHLAPQVGRRPLRDDVVALVDDEHPVAGHLDLGQDVARYEDRHAAPQAGDQVADDQDLVRVEADRRLVHDDDRRLGEHGLGDADPLAEARLREHPLRMILWRVALQVSRSSGDLIDPGAELAARDLLEPSPEI